MEKTTQASTDFNGNNQILETSNISSDYAVEIFVPTDSLATLYSKPFLLVPDPGKNKVIEFIDAVFIYKFGTKSMSDGGSIYISYLGFSTLSDAVSAITLIGDDSNKVIPMQLAGTADMILPVNFGLYLQMTECDFDKGISTSSAKLHVIYRIHTIE